MGQLYPQVLFSTTGMVSVFVIVLILEVLSIGYFVMTVVEFRILHHRHTAFFKAMNGGEMHSETYSHVVFWLYVLSTIVITLVTSTLFFWQPHLL